MFPISDSIKADRFPFLTIALILITIVVFIQQLLAPDFESFIKTYALIPARVDFSILASLMPFVTAIFLHGGFLHIVSNMWFLWIFGDDVEAHLPRIVYLLLYFAAGVIGNFVQYVLMPTSTIPMLGASGAVAGILGCYFVMFPYSKIKTIIFIFFYFTIIDISAPIMLGYWFVLQLISGAVSLPFLSDQGGVAFFAHIAGFVVGILVGLLFKRNAQQVEQLAYE
jgi:membrane associated rhomboid family serine protease